MYHPWQTYYPQPIFGECLFVDAKHGRDSLDGLVPDRPLETMEEAFTRVRSGETIFFRGKVREQVTAPDGVFDVTIVGRGARPRHADDHTELGGRRGSSASSWLLPASPEAATALLSARNQGWRLVNFLMQASSNQVCVDLVTNSESGDDEHSAGHFSVHGMRFDGAGIGIRDNGPAGFVGIYDSLFRGMTTAIGKTAGAGPGTRSWWEIAGNRFESNTNHIVAELDRASVHGNFSGDFTTTGFDVSGGTVGLNQVTGNTLMGDYDTGYAAHADDMWLGNVSIDTASGNVDAAGRTTDLPGAGA